MKRYACSRKQMVLLALFVLLNVCRNFLWVTPSAMMAPMMEDLALNYRQVGQLSLIVTVFMGVFLIVGSALLGKLGAVNAMIWGQLFFAVDAVCSFFGNSFLVVFSGKVFCGIGYGLTTCATTALIAASFRPEQLGKINGINSCLGSLTISVAYRFLPAICRRMGSWRTPMLLFGSGAVCVAGFFFLWNKISNCGHMIGTGKKELVLRGALQYLEIRKFLLIVSTLMLVYVSVNSYYPNYLHQTKHFSLEDAGSLAGLISIAGMAGSLLAGGLAHRIRYPKRFLFGLVLLFCSGFFGMVFLAPGVPLIAATCCFGAAYLAISSFSTTMIMRLPDIKPLEASAGVSLMNACGSLVAIAVPSVQQFFIDKVGMKGAMLAFAVLFVPSIAGMLSLPKTFGVFENKGDHT